MYLVSDERSGKKREEEKRRELSESGNEMRKSLVIRVKASNITIERHLDCFSWDC